MIRHERDESKLENGIIMCVNERQDNGSGTMNMHGQEMAKVEDFKYMGSTVQSNEEFGREVRKRVQAGWNVGSDM